MRSAFSTVWIAYSLFGLLEIFGTAFPPEATTLPLTTRIGIRTEHEQDCLLRGSTGLASTTASENAEAMNQKTPIELGLKDLRLNVVIHEAQGVGNF